MLEKDQWEGLEQWHERRVSSGMHGMQLLAHYEVVDAEPAGIIMMAIKMTAEWEDARERKCLIMSGCIGAMRMVETAWRAKRSGQYAMGDRGGMVEAICTYRERIGRAVLMYVPAHRGFSANAYTDAAAKIASTKAKMSNVSTKAKMSNVSEIIQKAIKWKRHVNEVLGAYR